METISKLNIGLYDISLSVPRIVQGFFILDYYNVEVIDTPKFQPESIICFIQLGIDQQKGNK